ncbi:hypothetical protein BKA66DRAFT_513315 [Pyrenochaeta sp. MPI-SDFR-AT-0127]|nr:hypothetical protein BKA66DRAFT_513315 [Pyrenochaeta sp. MPI-SDFR-AT-0127]
MTSTSASSTSSSQMPEESQTGLPGMKRGIAIGVACSVAVILIALLAFFAYRRRNRIFKKHQTSEEKVVEAPNNEVWPQEKALQKDPPPPPSPPPVEAEARTIYEMDANQIPELPTNNYTDVQEVECMKQSDRTFSFERDGEDAYTKKVQPWKTSSVAYDHKQEPTNREDDYRRLPLLTISPPEGCSGNVSPLLISPWDASSRTTSPAVSPLPDAHFPSNRYEH